MINYLAQVNIRDKFGPADPNGRFADEKSLGPAVGDLYSIAIFFAFIIAFILVIWGGIKLITAGGDEKAVEAGRKTITFAIVGLVLIIVAYFIVWILQRVTGLAVLSS